MNNDDNSIQQNLPLSWDESEQNIEENLQLKPLLLKKTTEAQIQEMDEYEESSQQNLEGNLQPKSLILKRADDTPAETEENDHSDEIVNDDSNSSQSSESGVITAPRPLLLKKAADVQSEPPSKEGKSSKESEESEIDDFEDFEDYESEMDDHEVDYSDYSDPDKKTISYLKVLQENSEDSSSEENEELAENDDSEDINQNKEESELKTEEENIVEDHGEVYIPYELENDSEEEVKDILPPETEDISATDSTPLFEETGTFSLEHEPEDSEEETSEQDADSTDEHPELENRIEIEEESLEESLEDKLSEEETSEQDANPAVEESVFALKAETYYEVESEKESERVISSEQELESDSEAIEENVVPADVTTHESYQTLGALLQEARLAKSFTIKDASEATRIKNSYIIALENNDLDELPAKVYILNYIRQLAREYDISHTPLIESYEKQVGENESGDQHVIRVGDDEARKATKPASRLNAIVVTVALVLVGGIISAAFYMKWLSPQTNLVDHPSIEINLDVLKEPIKLPTPEFPVPEK